MAYHSSSIYKDRCRDEVYSALDNSFSKSRPEGKAVILAGPHAAEIPYLRARFATEQCVVVDIKETAALAKTAEELPGAVTYQEDIAGVVRRLDKIAFVNYDFCCGIRAEYVTDAYWALEGRVSKGTVIAVTLNQRESFPDTPRAWRDHKEYLRKVAGIRRVSTLAEFIHQGQTHNSQMRTFVLKVIYP